MTSVGRLLRLSLGSMKEVLPLPQLFNPWCEIVEGQRAGLQCVVETV
ncbi:MAG: hypothetical protein IIC95_11310 [Chloroflexi bacterium]|nr:hypothetical protein [Chloroflexota bacterium]